MSGWRYLTVACQRIWRFYRVVGPAERPSWFWPCAKASVAAAPMIVMPGPMAPGIGAGPPAELPPISAPPVLAPGAGYFGGWPEMPAQGGIEYAAVGGGVPVPFGLGIVAPLIPPLAPVSTILAPPSPISPPLPPETLIEVPEPASLWILAGAVLATIWGRR